jgi:hypothetical protein
MDRDLDAAQVSAALVLDSAWVATLQSQWQEMIKLAVWGDLTMTRLGAAPRLRKRLLELGERLKSLCADRTWIPHPREQLKSALAAALGVRETLAAVETLLPELADSTDAARLQAVYRTLVTLVEQELPALENAWAQLLDGQVDA